MNTLGRYSQTHQGAPGQSLVEFALTLPLLLIILWGAVDLGRLYNAYVAITNASREGARYGISNPTDTPGIDNRIVTEAAGSGITIDTVADPNAITVSCYTYSSLVSGSPAEFDCDSAYKGDAMQVKVELNYQMDTLYLIGIGTVRLSTSTTMSLIKGQ